MNNKQLCEHIGNIDDQLIQQAQQMPDFRQQRRLKRRRLLTAAAAAAALAATSFRAGALAYARETTVEVPVKQETAVLEDIGLTLILPDNWKGRYSIEKKDQNYIFFLSQIREAGTENAPEGILFTIVCYEEVLTPEQFVKKGYDFTGWQYLFSTSRRTYILHHASDVQWDPDSPQQEKQYLETAAQIADIRFVLDDALTQ